MTSDRTPTEREPRTDWTQRRANLRLGNALERIGVHNAPLSVFELRAAVLRDEKWDANTGDPHDAGWAAAYDRRGLLNLVSVIEREAAGAATETGGLDARDLAALNELERDLAAGEVEHMGDVWQRLRAILDAPGQRQLAARLSVHPDREDAPDGGGAT